MGSSKSRYFLYSEFDLDLGEFYPRWLFEEKSSGEIVGLDPGGISTPIILQQRWGVAKTKAKKQPDTSRLEEVRSDDLMRLEMEIRIREDSIRSFGESRKGDYVWISSEANDFDAVAYGKVLDPLKEDFFLILILGVERNRKEIYEDLFETDGKDLLRKVKYASEIEPGKIYAFEKSGAAPISPELMRWSRHHEFVGSEWVHVPDEVLDSEEGKTKFKRK